MPNVPLQTLHHITCTAAYTHACSCQAPGCLEGPPCKEAMLFDQASSTGSLSCRTIMCLQLMWPQTPAWICSCLDNSGTAGCKRASRSSSSSASQPGGDAQLWRGLSACSVCCSSSALAHLHTDRNSHTQECSWGPRFLAAAHQWQPCQGNSGGVCQAAHATACRGLDRLRNHASSFWLC